MLTKFESIWDAQLRHIDVFIHRIEVANNEVTLVHLGAYRVGLAVMQLDVTETRHTLAKKALRPANVRCAAHTLFSLKEPCLPRRRDVCLISNVRLILFLHWNNPARLASVSTAGSWELSRYEIYTSALPWTGLPKGLERQLWFKYEARFHLIGREIWTNVNKHQQPLHLIMGCTGPLQCSFGIESTSMTFQRAIYANLVPVFCLSGLVYLNDTALFLKSSEDDIEQVRHVLWLLHEAGVRLLLEK